MSAPLIEHYKHRVDGSRWTLVCLAIYESEVETVALVIMRSKTGGMNHAFPSRALDTVLIPDWTHLYALRAQEAADGS